MKKTVALMLVLIFAVAGAMALVAQTNPKGAVEVLPRADAIGLLRTFNTTEAELSLTGKHYASLDLVIEQQRFKRSPFKISLADSTSGTVNGYKVSVIASADGRHYEVSLMPQEPCGDAVFGNESAIVYFGRAGGCEKSR